MHPLSHSFLLSNSYSQCRQHDQASKLSFLLTIAFTTLAPISAQAALPEMIQTALTRAELSPNDISIIVTPVGDKNASRLPPIVHVIDSDNSSDTSNSNTTSTLTNPKTVTANSSSDNNKTDNSAIIVNQQDIKRQVRQLEAYTDDPYTHQSIENTPPILPTSTASSTNSTINSAATPDKSAPNPLLSHNSNTKRTPASTMKLIPSFIALDTLGADFVWHTRIYHTGLIIGNRLHGNLIIQGSGDPKMTHKRLQDLLYQVQQAGIHHIDGDIIIDSAIFNNVSKNPATFDNAPLRPYNASPDGFLVNFSSMGINTYPLGHNLAQLSYTPQLVNYQLPSIINTRSASCSYASNSLAPQWRTDKLTFNAKMPNSCGEHIFYIVHPDAKEFAARVIAAKWQALSNTLSGKVISQEKPYNAYKASIMTDNKQSRPFKRGLAALSLSPLPIVSYPSLTLTQQIYDINHFSNNVLTEQVALSIGAYNQIATINKKIAADKPTSLYQFGNTKSTSYPQALQTINQWWQTNLTTPPPHLTNGSGLCRDCTVTAANLDELLSYAYSHPSFNAYVNSLGVAGVSGTIVYHSERLPDSAAIGRAWIKTGTLNNVTAMAGYVKAQSGQDYSVVGLINTERAINPDIARPVLDAMLDWTARQ